MRVETARDDRSARRRTARRLGRQFVVSTALVAIGAVGSVGARAALAAAQAGNTSAGVYSDAQSARGQSISEKSCESCHGMKLSGSDIGPTLVGDFFTSNWADRSVGDLYEKIHTTMPADAPGTLSPAQTADVIAYIFKLNKFPAGSNDLAGEAAALNAIKIAKP
jgi:mono/diheme cytochrome c family protein